jgi:hypothetical protein
MPLYTVAKLAQLATVNKLRDFDVKPFYRYSAENASFGHEGGAK